MKTLKNKNREKNGKKKAKQDVCKAKRERRGGSGHEEGKKQRERSERKTVKKND